MSIGYVLYHGPSVLEPSTTIVAILTLTSRNRKTGNIPQLWIMRADMEPTHAQSTGEDTAICGQCIHRSRRGGGQGTCYVVAGRGPLAVYRAWKNGRYPVALPEDLCRVHGQTVRIGAYGDPAAIPREVLASLDRHAGVMLGYTHQERHARFDPAVLRHAMVSVESESDAYAYRDMGLRTFRVRPPGGRALPFETVCPAESTPGMSCATCRRCDGASRTGNSIVTTVHGTSAKRFIPVVQI